LKIVALALIASMTASLVSAQTRPNTVPFTSRLEQSRTTMRVDASGLHGAGSTVLAEAMVPARYVLVGEDHLSREIPQFTSGLCRLMAPGGLDALAVEIGPEAAHVVNGNLRKVDRISRVATFMHAHPDAFAFQNGRDESDMAAECARLAGPRFEVWGLDQEFFGAAGYLFEQMLAAHPGPAARAAIAKLASIDRAATAKALKSGSPGDLFIYSVTDQQLAAARPAIVRDGGERAGSLFEALSATRTIYLGQNTDGFASNGQRALLMKRTLMHYLDASPRPARVLFKFGDVHMEKGVNALGQRDLGNFVAERADGENAPSLHIAVYGAKGVHALYGGVGRQARQEPFVLTDDPDYAWLKDALPAQRSTDATRDWTVLDLRPIRAHMPADINAPWRRMVERYDLIVMAPQLTPSTLIGAN
jgi:hypothetical protein